VTLSQRITVAAIFADSQPKAQRLAAVAARRDLAAQFASWSGLRIANRVRKECGYGDED
jgi:hypothetical protein